MTLRALLTLTAILAISAAAPQARASDLPPVKTTERNKVPACVTPGRLMTFVHSRNERLDARFEGIATEYMRHGEDLSIRWDIAFFQMLLETGNLAFGGDVKPKQNNFAGLGATGNGEPGESFKDVSHGVRAHLEHLLMYSGEKIANPVAERTRKVQEWGVLTEWQKSLKGPVTFAQLAKKWAPPARKYAADIEAVAESFMTGPCKEADPKPELVAAARKGLLEDAMRPAPGAKTTTAAAPAEISPPSTAGEDAVRRSVDATKAEGTQRSALGGAVGGQSPTVTSETSTSATAAPSKPFKLINPGAPGGSQSETTVAAAAPAATAPGPTGASPPAAASPAPPAPATAAAPGAKVAAAGPAASTQKPAKPAKEPAGKEAGGKEPSKCNVFTASYGGQKSVIIKVVSAEAVNYTVLDVNEGAETRETEAYIAAYAKGGKTIGDFKTQAMALDRAFELCPEG